MSILTTQIGDVPSLGNLVDELGNPLTDDLPPFGGGNIGSDLIVFTTMMSFLLMVFGGDAINNFAAKVP